MTKLRLLEGLLCWVTFKQTKNHTPSVAGWNPNDLYVDALPNQACETSELHGKNKKSIEEVKKSTCHGLEDRARHFEVSDNK